MMMTMMMMSVVACYTAAEMTGRHYRRQWRRWTMLINDHHRQWWWTPAHHRSNLLTSCGVCDSPGVWRLQVRCSRVQSSESSTPYWRRTDVVMRPWSSMCWCAGMVMRIPVRHMYSGRWRSVGCRGFLSMVYDSVALPAPLLALRPSPPGSWMTLNCRIMLAAREQALYDYHHHCSACTNSVRSSTCCQ